MQFFGFKMSTKCLRAMPIIPARTQLNLDRYTNATILIFKSSLHRVPLEPTLVCVLPNIQLRIPKCDDVCMLCLLFVKIGNMHKSDLVIFSYFDFLGKLMIWDSMSLNISQKYLSWPMECAPLVPSSISWRRWQCQGLVC